MIGLYEFVAVITQRFQQAGLAFGHGTATAHDEACWLAAHVLQLDVTAPLPDIPLAADQQQRIEALARLRIESRKPLAYLLGEAWFCGLPFAVDESTVVPRSPLAELIEERFHPWVDATGAATLLDIGTGSGCIAIACACAMPWLAVTGTDIDERALAVAARNAERHGVAGRCRWLQADLWPAGRQAFDIIVSNPPYVPRAERRGLPPEYLHEPARGLYSGADGLEHAARMLVSARRRLRDGGLLVLELGAAAGELQEQLPMVDFIWPELARGGEGVLLADAATLARHGGAIEHWYRQREAD